MEAIFQSLIESPLLLGDLPEACGFERDRLERPPRGTVLDFDQKLGHLYEDALAMILECSPAFDLLERGLQLRDPGKTTLGEIDFLLRDLRSGQFIHLELATKFYLAVETKNGLTLPGPDSRDNFFRKLQRMRTHQLILTEKFRELLPEGYREEILLGRHLVCGCIFDHIGSTNKVHPEYANPKRRQGRWLTVDQVPQRFPPTTNFGIIPKWLWPVPLEMISGVSLDPWSPGAPLQRCVMLRADGEDIPYFVTPADYPGQ